MNDLASKCIRGSKILRQGLRAPFAKVFRLSVYDLGLFIVLGAVAGCAVSWPLVCAFVLRLAELGVL